MLKAFISCALMLTVPSTLSLAAETNRAMLIGSGQVEINGGLAARNSTLLPGDLIQTAPNASAVVNAKGAMLSIGGGSAIEYRGNSLTFQRGVVIVRALNAGMTARFGDLTISSSTNQAKFQLTDANGVEQIAALEGPLNISSGGRSFKLNQGQMMTRMSAAEQNDAGTNSGQQGNDSGDPKKQEPGVIAQATSSGFFDNWKIGAIIGAVAVGALAGAGFAGAFDSKQASPSTVH